MQLLTAAPATPADLAIVYERTAREGMVHSGLMRGERFEIAEDYNEDWACASVTWSAGGEEEYRFLGDGAVNVRSAGVLTLARGARYAYAALGDAPFRSNMISFPRWITDAAEDAVLEGEAKPAATRLETRLTRPDAALSALMNAIVARCRSGETDDDWYAEKCALLYAGLIEAQDQRAAARERIEAVKPGTRAELARRAETAKKTILQRFGEHSLALNDIAREACLSPYHLIRVFKAVAGTTPAQFLKHVRMDAALRLLKETRLSTGEIAHAVGYSDRTAFFKAFRKHYGAAPSAMERMKA
ncbi:AraC family transcriptional regulator [Hyphococcus luteus]|uniref:HTH araC/xylS-type domain-containing protein n=1 Tax=Hyphococcus luteus TaxID=2058213 RepID=A0A2S7K070_9PROT|nr:AraC family transcriptional regulator [Marinicaulis flavus]PQA85828.1 hypothetical protein CW354_20000 [Marinicaulis flavus]